MKKKELKTPTILLNIEALKNNIKNYQKLCTENKKELWPMIKTHKSMEIVEMQINEGATGVLCGTLDEAEACCEKGIKKIMYAYPVASEENIKRIIEISKKTDFIIRLDSLEAAIKINKMSEENIKRIIEISKKTDFIIRLDSLEAAIKINKMSEENIKRIIEISKKTDFIIRLDSLEAAIKINKMAEVENVVVSYSIIVDSGLHRFGLSLKNLLNFTEELKKLKNLKLRGISSHPGHVYSSICEEDIHKYVLDECETLKQAKDILEKEGYHLEYITSGSTPTFIEAVKDLNINVYHPGNYVFLDSIQYHSCSTANLCTYYTVVDGDDVIKSIKVDARGNSVKRI
ncbi:alanine racemase [Fusobacterium polymorphum]|uniref:alanine racemase n=3 Tax=Fusobacterium nucleatum subsp. polymorphum TaxID=76857 RepID=UPI003008D425